MLVLEDDEGVLVIRHLNAGLAEEKQGLNLELDEENIPGWQRLTPWLRTIARRMILNATFTSGWADLPTPQGSGKDASRLLDLCDIADARAACATAYQAGERLLEYCQEQTGIRNEKELEWAGMIPDIREKCLSGISVWGNQGDELLRTFERAEKEAYILVRKLDHLGKESCRLLRFLNEDIRPAMFWATTQRDGYSGKTGNAECFRPARLRQKEAFSSEPYYPTQPL